MQATGIIYLVHAGTGDADCLTLRAAELLSQADTVVTSAPVGGDVLKLVADSAELVTLDQSADGFLDQLTETLVSKARAGLKVVRLQSGDPHIEGWGWEEARRLAGTSVPFEVVVGVSSVFQALANAGVPVSHPPRTGGFSFRNAAGSPAQLDTRIVLIRAETVEAVAQGMVGGGADPGTLATAVGLDRPFQLVEGTLESVGRLAAKARMAAPMILAVGSSVSNRVASRSSHGEALRGLRVAVTRAREQAGPLTRALRDRGADVIEVPTIKVAPPSDFEPLIESIAGIGEYDWLVFTSPNGVTAFFDYFFRAFDDLRDIGGVRIAAVGPATTARLKDLRLKVDLVPARHLASEIARELAGFESLENLRFLLARAEAATPELPKLLEEMGAIVDDVACYRTVIDTDDRANAAARLLDDGADWVLFTSGSTVENFHARFDLPKLMGQFPGLRLASIGPETTKALSGLGIRTVAEASIHTIDGLVRAVQQAALKDGREKQRHQG